MRPNGDKRAMQQNCKLHIKANVSSPQNNRRVNSYITVGEKLNT
jgi:hypothetical protein